MALSEHDRMHILRDGYDGKCFCLCALCALPAQPGYGVQVWCVCLDCKCAETRPCAGYVPLSSLHRKTSVNTLMRYMRAASN